MKAMSLILILTIFVSCGKDAGEKKSINQAEPDSLTISPDDHELKEIILKQKIWKQSELMMTIVMARGTRKNSFRKLDRMMNINCNETTGNCSVSSKERQ